MSCLLLCCLFGDLPIRVAVWFLLVANTGGLHLFICLF